MTVIYRQTDTSVEYCAYLVAASFTSYVGMACMFSKMLNAVLFARQNPIYAVVYVLACFCGCCQSLLPDNTDRI